jgi:hypothetical protein
MKRKISQQDLDAEIRSNLAAAGAPEPESLGEVLRTLPDRSGASHWAMPAFPGLMRYVALAAVVALAAAAVGLPLMLTRPGAASESAETSLVADSSAEPSAWSTDLPSGSPELWSDDPSGSPSTAPSEVPSAEPSQVPTATRSAPTSGPSVGPAGLFYSTGSMRRADVGQTATLLHDGRVLITPGTGYDGAPSVEAEVYEPNTGKFSQTYQMTEIVAAPEATLLADGRVLITGGYDPTVNISTYLRTAELYDPTTNRFTATGLMNAARCGHTATLLKNGRVLIVGGDQLAGATAELYDPSTGKFTPTDSTSSWLQAHTATRLADGRVLIAGGASRTGRSQQAELYDPGTGKFSATGSMATGRVNHTATLLSDGRVLIAGGEGDGALSSAEIYNPATGTFTTTGSMHTARQLHAAVLLPNGSVLIAGGMAGGPGLASAELYNPGTGKFTAIGNMTKARSFPAAAPLTDGRVLIAGGSDESYRVLASAELYEPERWAP